MFLTKNNFFRINTPWVTFLGDKNQHHQTPISIHIDKLLASLSLPTVSMFQFILGSRLKQKRFLPTEKMLVFKIVKLCKQIKASSIPSLKIRSIVNNFSQFFFCRMSFSNLETLYKDFTNPDSRNFANINVEQIFQNAQQDASRHPVSRHEISQLQLSLESLSRAKERRILRGKVRKVSFRKWLFFSPRHTILGT